jgi:hypothetical protein
LGGVGGLQGFVSSWKSMYNKYLSVRTCRKLCGWEGVGVGSLSKLHFKFGTNVYLKLHINRKMTLASYHLTKDLGPYSLYFFLSYEWTQLTSVRLC